MKRKMDHWEMSDLDPRLDRYRNPSRPVNDITATGNDAVGAIRELHGSHCTFAYERRPAHQHPDYSFRDIRSSFLDDLNMAIKTKPEHSDSSAFFEMPSPIIINFDESDEETDTEMRSDTFRSENAKEPDQDLSARLKRYHTRYIKLSHHYYKRLKERHENHKIQREKSEEELKEMKKKNEKMALELMALQTKNGGMEAQLQLNNEKFQSLKTELQLERSNSRDYMQINQNLSKRVKELEAALQQVVGHQVAAFNVQREMLEKTHISCQPLFLKESATPEPV